MQSKETVCSQDVQGIVCQAKELELKAKGSLEGLEDGCATYNRICASERSLWQKYEGMIGGGHAEVSKPFL